MKMMDIEEREKQEENLRRQNKDAKLYDYKGKKVTLNFLAGIARVPKGTMYWWLKRMTPEEAVAEADEERYLREKKRKLC